MTSQIVRNKFVIYMIYTQAAASDNGRTLKNSMEEEEEEKEKTFLTELRTLRSNGEPLSVSVQ